MKKSLILTFVSVAAMLAAGEQEFIRQELACGGAVQHFRINAGKPEDFNNLISDL